MEIYLNCHSYPILKMVESLPSVMQAIIYLGFDFGIWEIDSIAPFLIISL